MTEMQIINPAPTNIQLDQQSENRPILTRKQESEKRKAEFFEALDRAHEVESGIAKNQVETLQNVKERSAEQKEISDTHDDENEISHGELEENPLDSKHIPKKRFDKELEKRKVLEQELQRERESRIKYETELSLYNKAIEQMQNQQSQPQQPEIDPIDSDAHNLYMQKIRDLENKYENQNQNISDYQARQQFAATVDKQAAEYTRDYPDFNDAYSYLLNVEASKAKMLGYNDLEAQSYAIETLQPLAWKSYVSGKNVADMAYNMAKNYGYKTPDAKNAQTKLEPDLDTINKNMRKSYSALDEVPGVSTSVAAEQAAFLTMEGFKRKLSGKNNRGTNLDEFYKAMDKLRNVTKG